MSKRRVGACKISNKRISILNVNNIAQEGARQYMFMESRARSQWVVPRTLKFGLTGQF